MVDIGTFPRQVSDASITSQINLAQSPQALVCALVSDSISALLEFDYCTLVLPRTDGMGLRTWRASRVSNPGKRLSEAAMLFAEPHEVLARLLAGGASKVLEESELCCPHTEQFGDEAKSALALPLSFGGRTFGMVCFSSHQQDAFGREDLERLMWLADHVAAVSHSMLLAAQLECLSDAQREIHRLKNGFVNTLVRNVRVPLTSVLGLLEMFEGKLQAREPFDLEDRQLLRSAIEHGDRMRRLLDDHLEVAKQQEQPLLLHLEEVTTGPLLEQLVEPLRGEAALRGVELNLQSFDPKLTLHVDVRQARRALNHLFMAALDATPDGGTVNIEAHAITGNRAGDEGRRLVVINIADSGAGLPAADVPYVFDAFWQSPGNNSLGVDGVGLAIARRIAAAHGGSVTVRSQLMVGTTYSIVLPAANIEPVSDMRRVLIVDDMPDIKLLLGKLVERMGHQVELASHGTQALEILERSEIDLLITDWAMPGMNGGELITALKEQPQWRDIPTIILTGHDTEFERSEARMAGCDRFLVKPVKRDVLENAINDLLREQETWEGREEGQRERAVALSS